MLRLFLKVGVSAVLLAIIVWNLDAVGEVGRLLTNAAPLYVVLALLIMTLDRVLMSFKWLALLKSRGLNLPLFQGFKIYCAAMVWGMFLPTTVGADAIRGYLTSRHGINQYEVFASIAVERVVGFVASLLFGLAGLLILSSVGATDERFDPVWWAGAAAMLCAVVAVSLSFSEALFKRVTDLLPIRIRESGIVRRLRHFHDVYRGYGSNRDAIAAFFGLTLIEQYLSVVASWAIAVALHVDVGLLFITGVVPLAMLISRLPISIDGLGVYEGVFVVLMGLGGVAPAEAVAIALAGRLIQTAAWAPWWFLYSVETKRIRPPKGVAHR